MRGVTHDRRRRPRTIAGLSLVLVALAACDIGADAPGGSAATSSSDGAGRVDIGGYELAYECRGVGSPTIVAEAGYDSAGTSTWAGMMDDLAAVSHTCTYDRAGTGTSDARPDPDELTSADQASELHALLRAARIDGPYVLVAHSYGGFVARLFADAYAEETAGLVLVESSHEDEIDAYRAYYGDDPAGDWVDGGDLLDMRATESALRAARDYGATPLVVIRAERYEDVLDEHLWRSTQADLATLSRNSSFVVAGGSGHFVMDPDGNPAVIEAAVEAVVDAVRAGEELPDCVTFTSQLDASCPSPAAS